MLYLLFVLTFLCGILFYGMSPSDKKLQENSHQTEGMIISFLSQHQAAKDYLSMWLGAGPQDAGDSNIKEDDYLRPEFENMMYRFLQSEMCYNNSGTPGEDSCTDDEGQPMPGFVSRVVCTEANGQALADGHTCDTPNTKHYVITYGGWDTGYERPYWWPRKGSRMRRFESWRRAIANRTRGSVSCGVLFHINSKWCIDNGETVYKDESTPSGCMTTVPQGVLNVLPPKDGKPDPDYLDDLLFCMSEFAQGVEAYPQRPAIFYDGIANAGIGKHTNTISDARINLTNPANTFTYSAPVSVCGEGPCYSLNGGTITDSSIHFDGENYTITILAKIPESVSDSVLLGNGTDVFLKVYADCTSPSGGEVKDGPCLYLDSKNSDKERITSIPHNLTSWTIVKKDNNVTLYQNDNFSDTQTVNNINWNGSLNISGDLDIYGIRYYQSALEEKDIKKNFKVDQKRYGI